MYGTGNVLHSTAWSFRRMAQLSPMHGVLRKLRRRGIPLGRMDALEAFGGDGSRHTLDYCKSVRSLEVWEVDPLNAVSLKSNLPGASVSIVDSFREVKSTELTFDLVVVDCPASQFGPDYRYCEHFDFFNADLFRVLRESAVLILNVLPEQEGSIESRMKRLPPKHLSRRGNFYGTNRPATLSVDEMVRAYRSILNANGLELEWHFSQLRTIRSQVHYLVLKVRRNS